MYVGQAFFMSIVCRRTQCGESGFKESVQARCLGRLCYTCKVNSMESIKEKAGIEWQPDSGLDPRIE